MATSGVAVLAALLGCAGTAESDREPVAEAAPQRPSIVCPAGTAPISAVKVPFEGSACARPDGTLHGPMVAWWKDGAKEREGAHQDGLPSGAWTWWDREGRVNQTGTYVNGKMSGRWQAWRDGRPASDGVYEEGVQVGEWVEWSPATDKVSSRAHYNTGQDRLPSIRWHDNGAKAEEYTIVGHKYQGLYTTWHPNGQKAREGAYDADKPVGPWTWWSEAGAVERALSAEEVAANGL